MKLSRIFLALCAVLAATGVSAVAAAAAATKPTTLADIRAATAKYSNVRTAIADGYRRESPCESSAVGAMGIHYLNPRLAAQTAIVPRRPPILLYIPHAGGKLRLAGVEYFRADPDQNLRTSGGRPTLFGHPFDGPMRGHAPGMPMHFDLHVWIFAPNPQGTFAQYNPSLHC